MKRELSLSVLLASCLGMGFSPAIPGTVGAAAGIGVYMLAGRSLFAQGAAIIIFLCAGFLTSGRAERLLGKKDPRPVVIDELTGTLIAFYALPPRTLYLAAAFVLFRAFDIFKPWPAGRMEKLPGSAGIMLDDVFAALYANLAVRVFYNTFV